MLQAANTNYENFVKKSEVGHFSSSLSKILLLLNGTFTKTQILGKELVSFQKEQSELKQKVAELEKMADDTLFQLENTFDGLNGTPAEKQAAEEGFTSFEFMQSIDVESSKLFDGKPGPMTFQ